MSVEKTIIKQNKNYKVFVALMVFIFFLIPCIVIYCNKITFFYLIYAFILEGLVLFSIIYISSKQRLKYKIKGDFIIIKQGILPFKIKVRFSRILYVGIEQKKSNVSLVILFYSRINRKRFKKVDKKFMGKFCDVKDNLKIIKKNNTEYLYVIINKGGAKKYKLLMDLYVYCSEAYFSDTAIEMIKSVKK